MSEPLNAVEIDQLQRLLGRYADHGKVDSFRNTAVGLREHIIRALTSEDREDDVSILPVGITTGVLPASDKDDDIELRKWCIQGASSLAQAIDIYKFLTEGRPQ